MDFWNEPNWHLMLDKFELWKKQILQKHKESKE